MVTEAIDLVAEARRGDSNAFGELVKPLYQPAERLAVSMVSSREVARDLVQEAVLAAWLSLSSLQNDASFASWLYGITLNLCRSHLRGRREEELSLEVLTGGQWYPDRQLVDAPPTPEEIAEAADMGRLVRSALEMLPPRTQRAAGLFYLEGLTLRETAILMRVSVGTVKAHLHKARGDLRELVCVALDTAILTTERSPMTRVSIWDVIEATGGYTVVLEDSDKQKCLPITIGVAEGQALLMGLRNITMPRPLTYHLMANILSELGAELTEVRIEKLVETCFYAVVVLKQAGATKELDCRPSDAMCLAMRFGAPIYVADEIMQEAGREKQDGIDITVNETAVSADGTGIDKLVAKLYPEQSRQ